MSVKSISAIQCAIISVMAVLILLHVPNSAAHWDEPTTNETVVIAADDQANNGETADTPAEETPNGADVSPMPQATLLHFVLGAIIFLPVAIGALFLFVWLGWHRLDRTPPRLVAWTAPTGIMLFLAAWGLSMFGLLAARHFFGFGPEQHIGLRENVLMMAGMYAAEAIVMVIVLILWMRTRKAVVDRMMHPLTAVALGVGALPLFWLFAITLSLLVSLVLHLVQIAPDRIAHQVLAQLVEGERDVWFFALAGLVIFIAPVFEEVLYRGILQRVLGSLAASRWVGIIGASTVFAIMHVAAAPTIESLPAMLSSLFLISLGFGWAYEKSGRLIAPITMHVLFNAGNLVLGMLIP